MNKRQRKKQKKKFLQRAKPMAAVCAEYIRTMLRRPSPMGALFWPLPVLEAPFGATSDVNGVVHRTGVRPATANLNGDAVRAPFCVPDGFVETDNLSPEAVVTCLVCLSL